MRPRRTRHTLRFAAGVAGSVALMVGVWAIWLEPASLRIEEQHLDVEWPARRRS
jgi:hypothetical protein